MGKIEMERTVGANAAAGEAARKADASGVRFGAAAGVQVRDHADLDTVNDAWRLPHEATAGGHLSKRWRREAGQQQQSLRDATNHVETCAVRCEAMGRELQSCTDEVAVGVPGGEAPGSSATQSITVARLWRSSEEIMYM